MRKVYDLAYVRFALLACLSPLRESSDHLVILAQHFVRPAKSVPIPVQLVFGIFEGARLLYLRIHRAQQLHRLLRPAELAEIGRRVDQWVETVRIPRDRLPVPGKLFLRSEEHTSELQSPCNLV